MCKCVGLWPPKLGSDAGEHRDVTVEEVYVEEHQPNVKVLDKSGIEQEHDKQATRTDENSNDEAAPKDPSYDSPTKAMKDIGEDDRDDGSGVEERRR